jgi:hypothetical protein
VEEIFDRCLPSGHFKLDFDDFERSIILLGSVYYPDSTILQSYISFVGNVIDPLICSVSKRISQKSIDKLVCLSEIVMEKNSCIPFSLPLLRSCASSSRRSRSAELLGDRRPEHCGRSPPVSTIAFDKLVNEIKSRKMRRDPINENVAAVPPEPLFLDDSPDMDSEPISFGMEHSSFESPRTQVRLISPPVRKLDSPMCDSPLIEQEPSDPIEVRFPTSRPGFPPRSKVAPIVSSQLVSVLEEPDLVLAPRNSSQLDRILKIHSHTSEFVELLIKSFGSLDLAFDFIDRSVGNPSGKLSITKFSFAVKAIQYPGDWKGIFHHIDIKSDGCIDMNELRVWKETRSEQIKQLKRFYGVGDTIFRTSN